MLLLAGAPGLEPGNAGIKIQCLTNLATPQRVVILQIAFVCVNYFVNIYKYFLDSFTVLPTSQKIRVLINHSSTKHSTKPHPRIELDYEKCHNATRYKKDKGG